LKVVSHLWELIFYVQHLRFGKSRELTVRQVERSTG
jgi:hypothetical protein